MAGVGGSTVAEAKENLTVDEFFHWCEYRNKYGPLSLQMLLARMLATTNHLITQGAGIGKKDGTKFKPADFLLGTQSVPKDLSDIEDLGEFLNNIQ